MTLDEAIKHAEEVAEEQEKLCKRYANAIGHTHYLEYAKKHRQLAEWLKELKAVKDLIKQHDEDSMPEDFWYIDKIREAVQE